MRRVLAGLATAIPCFKYRCMLACMGQVASWSEKTRLFLLKEFISTCRVDRLTVEGKARLRELAAAYECSPEDTIAERMRLLDDMVVWNDEMWLNLSPNEFVEFLKMSMKPELSKSELVSKTHPSWFEILVSLGWYNRDKPLFRAIFLGHDEFSNEQKNIFRLWIAEYCIKFENPTIFESFGLMYKHAYEAGEDTKALVEGIFDLSIYHPGEELLQAIIECCKSKEELMEKMPFLEQFYDDDFQLFVKIPTISFG